MNLIFVGPQGSGKGTQAKIISAKLGLGHISTGDLLRSCTGGLKDETESYILKGNLVPDDLMLRILKERLKGNFILDGYPRNIEQARALDSITKIDKVIEISISDEEAVSRIINRLSCSKCGAVFNIVTNPPSVEGKCDKCGEDLKKRGDDTEESLRRRLEIYHSETEPILKKYDSIKINGVQEIGKVSEDILRELEYFSENHASDHCRN